MSKIRVRFAPSPTGGLHLGGVRTALYNYLFAKQHDGDFILRVEDTDQTRYVEGAEQYIIDCLKWCNILPNEGPHHPGEYGPYRQSERKNIYKEYADQLVKSGHAYYAFDTPEEIEKLREKLKAQGKFNLFNLGTREYVEVNDSAKIICGKLGVTPEFSYSGGDRGWIGDSPFIFLDTAKVNALGWEPKLSIAEAVGKTVEWLQANPWVMDSRV